MGRKEEMFQYAREKLTPYISERANLLRKDCAAYLEMIELFLICSRQHKRGRLLGRLDRFTTFLYSIYRAAP